MDQELSREWLSEAGLDPSLYQPFFQQAGGVRLKALIELWRDSCLDEALQALGVTTLGARRSISLAVERAAQQSLELATTPVSSLSLNSSYPARNVKLPADRRADWRLDTAESSCASIPVKVVCDFIPDATLPSTLNTDGRITNRSAETRQDGTDGTCSPADAGDNRQPVANASLTPMLTPEQCTVGVKRMRLKQRSPRSAGYPNGIRQQTLLECGIVRRMGQVAADEYSEREANNSTAQQGLSNASTMRKPAGSAESLFPPDKLRRGAKTTKVLPRLNKSSDAKIGTKITASRGGHPARKLIAGAPGCVVDSFRAPMRADDGFRHFFLTHYHADHYGGLRRTHFRPECKRFLYASPITANILQTEYQLDDSVLIRIPVGNPDGITVYENAELREPKPLVRVMACDANHCPGAVIFVFWVYATGQFVVHCGDMRYDPARMGIDPILTRLAASQHEPVVRVQYLHIDTTYSNPRYDFAPQQAVLQALTEAAQREAAQAPTLFLCGTYFIGKERVWTSLARALGTKVYVDPAWRRKRRVLVECMRLSPEEPSPYAALLTERIQESCVHLVRMADVQPNQLQRALRRAQTLGFRQLVGVMATGWCHSPVPESGSRRLDGRPAPKPTLLQRTPLPNNRFCVLYKLPYSEHSSCTELKAFIDWIRPNQIVPTVPTRATHLQRLLPK